MIINTIQDCEQAMLAFNLTGYAYPNFTSQSITFQIIKPKFKWFQFIAKRKFAQRYMWFMDFIEKNMTLGIVKLFNLKEA